MKKQETIELNVKNEEQLLNYLYKNVQGKSKNNIKSLLKNGQVFVNNKKQTKFNFLLKENDVVKVQIKKLNK